LQRISVVTVSVLSGVGLILLFTPYAETGQMMDAVASCIAGVAMGWGLYYSFCEYGHKYLGRLTALTFAVFDGRQIYLALCDSPKDLVLSSLFLANSAFVIMLFIALAVAWALSDAARLKSVTGEPEVQVVTMFFDLRGSTQWAHKTAGKDFSYVKDFINELREWALEQVSAPPQGRPNLIKFLGDGFMFVWEVPRPLLKDTSNAIIKLADNMCTNYQQWINEDSFKQQFPWGVPVGIGLGVDVGPAIRFTFENGTDDYLGAPLNIAAKMQNLARPHGGGVIQVKVWKILNDNLRGKFPEEGMLKLGDEGVSVRGTAGVDLHN
jgi:class 3 adenylate cyclase